MTHDLAVNNYQKLRAIGFNPERASYYSAQWADYHVELTGHRLEDGKLYAVLAPHNGDQYELELHL